MIGCLFANGIESELLTGDASWVLPTKHSSALKRLNNAIAMIEALGVQAAQNDDFVTHACENYFYEPAPASSSTASSPLLSSSSASSPLTPSSSTGNVKPLDYKTIPGLSGLHFDIEPHTCEMWRQPPYRKWCNWSSVLIVK